ncbi:hypothetical protein Tco_0528780 [Tanacetum coccineum]
MINAEVDDSDNGDEEVTDAAKADAEKTSEVKDDAKKTELPPTSSSLSVSLGFGGQLLKLSSDSSLVSTVKDSRDQLIIGILTTVRESPSITIVTTLHPPPVSTTPPVPQQITTLIPTPTITTDAPTITTTISESNALSAVQLRVAKLEKDVSELKKIDLFTEALAALKTQVPSFVDKYLGSKVGDTPTVYLEQESEKTPSEILKIKKEQAEKQKMPKFTIKYTYKASLKEYDQKSTLYQTMHANKSFNKNPTNHRLYHALMEALIEDENAIDKGVADIVQDHKRKHDDDEDDDDEDPPVRPNQDKKTKRRRTKDSESSKKPSTTKETPKGKAPSKGSKTGHLGHLTVDADYFFNNDLEYLKSSDPDRTHTTSITKTKEDRYEIEGIEDMKSVMQVDELYKSSDVTLKKVQDEIHHRVLDFDMGYNKDMSRRKWTAIDKKRSKLMVELIDKHMRKRKIIQNLERLVGARELGMDYKVMTRIV